MALNLDSRRYKIMRKALVILSMLTLFGCGTQPKLEELINDMVVLTNFDETLDYKQFATYSMSMDTIGFQSNTSVDEYLANDYAKMITRQIKQNLDGTNHTMVDIGKGADIEVYVVVVNDLSVFQSFYPGNYYYPSYGYGGYGGYYGGYGYATTQYFQQAILAIEFVNSKTKETIWIANIGDLVNSYDTSQKTKEAIDQAFVQSPFLER